MRCVTRFRKRQRERSRMKRILSWLSAGLCLCLITNAAIAQERPLNGVSKLPALDGKVAPASPPDVIPLTPPPPDLRNGHGCRDCDGCGHRPICCDLCPQVFDPGLFGDILSAEGQRILTLTGTGAG